MTLPLLIQRSVLVLKLVFQQDLRQRITPSLIWLLPPLLLFLIALCLVFLFLLVHSPNISVRNFRHLFKTSDASEPHTRFLLVAQRDGMHAERGKGGRESRNNRERGFLPYWQEGYSKGPKNRRERAAKAPERKG